MYREIPLNPPSLWDKDPILTAIMTIAERTGSFAPPAGGTAQPGYVRVYNDPCIALAVSNVSFAQGSGVWQVEVGQNMEMAGETDGYVTFVIRFQGNASKSIGGFPAAPCPPPANYTPYSETPEPAPMFPLPGLGSAQSPGNMSILRPQTLATWESGIPYYNAGNYSGMLNQFYAQALDAAGPGGTVGTMEYWHDPQTALGTAPLPRGGFQSTGTGDWVAFIKAWTVNAAGLSILKMGGKAIQMLGGPPPVLEPMNWFYNGLATYHPQTSTYNPAYYTYSLIPATQFYNRFSI